MNFRSFWKGLILFSLTFLFSLFFTNWFIKNEPQKQETNQIQQDKNPKIASIEPKELNKNLLAEPKCKRYANNRENLSKLIKELGALLENQKSLNINEKKLHQQKILKNEREIANIMRENLKAEEKRKKQKNLSREEDLTHNLLLIENCVEY